mgnify:CR=1 FL=1
MRQVRVRARGVTSKPELPRYPNADAPLESALRSRRPAWFDGAFVDTPVYDGDRVQGGHEIEGPAIIEEQFTTIVLYPGHRAVLDELGNYAISIERR